MKDVIIITGAGQRLGKALAIGLSREGFRVVATAREIDKLESYQNRLAGDYLLAECDITDWDDCQDLVQKVVEKYGRIDGLINNANVYTDASLLDTDKSQLDSVISVAITGTTYISKAVLQQMATQRSGRIMAMLFAGSREGLKPAKGNPMTLYHLAKSGEKLISDLIEREASKYDIQVTPVYLKSVASDLDIDDSEAPEDANHPKEVVEAVTESLNSKNPQEIIIEPRR